MQHGIIKEKPNFNWEMYEDITKYQCKELIFLATCIRWVKNKVDTDLLWLTHLALRGWQMKLRFKLRDMIHSFTKCGDKQWVPADQHGHINRKQTGSPSALSKFCIWLEGKFWENMQKGCRHQLSVAKWTDCWDLNIDLESNKINLSISTRTKATAVYFGLSKRWRGTEKVNMLKHGHEFLYNLWTIKSHILFFFLFFFQREH